MQKLIAKYGLAAHLAILAVAPLVLSPFFCESVIAGVLLWLSLIAGLWTLLEPSMHGGERLHDARRRVVRSVLGDPLAWILLAVVLFSGLRALNTGIAFSYNAETAAWNVSAAAFSIFPGVVGSSGDLDFSAAVAFLVLVLACRHSLGRAARMAFLLLSSAFAGLAAILALWALREGTLGAEAMLLSKAIGSCSFVGFSFGLYLMGGIVSLVALFEDKWVMAVPIALLGISGASAGLFAFAPAYLVVGVVVAVLITMVYASFYVYWKLRSASECKLVVVAGIALTLGGFLLVVLLPSSVFSKQLAAFESLRFFPERYWEIRKVLSGVAFESWVSNLWIGTGLGSFPLDFRFAAKPENWLLLPRGATALSNGWWFLLVERGIVGLAFLVLPFGFLLISYVHRAVVGLNVRMLPHPMALLLPLTLVMFVGGAFFDCSALREEALMAMGSFAAISVAVLWVRKRG